MITKISLIYLFILFLAVKMASDDNLKTWVSDKLMTLLGYSQPTIVQYTIGLCNSSKIILSPEKLLYIIILKTVFWDSQAIFQEYLFGFAAKQATSPADLVGKLVEFGFASTDPVRLRKKFSQEFLVDHPAQMCFDRIHNEYTTILHYYPENPFILK